MAVGQWFESLRLCFQLVAMPGTTTFSYKVPVMTILSKAGMRIA